MREYAAGSTTSVTREPSAGRGRSSIIAHERTRRESEQRVTRRTSLVTQQSLVGPELTADEREHQNLAAIRLSGHQATTAQQSGLHRRSAHGIGNFRLPPAVTEGNARAASPDRSRAHVGERSFFLCTKYNCTRAFVPLTARVRARARERAARASQTRFPFARSCTGSIFCDPHARSSHVRHAKPVGAHHRPSSRPEPAARGEEARRPTSRTFTCHYLNVPVCS